VVSSALTSLGQGGSIWLPGKSFLGDWVAAAAVGVVVTPLLAVAAVVMTYELIELREQARRAPVPPARPVAPLPPPP
jgi:hypothetical protein